MIQKIAVTGSTGKARRAIVRDLVEHGYEVLGVDLVARPGPRVPKSEPI